MLFRQEGITEKCYISWGIGEVDTLGQEWHGPLLASRIDENGYLTTFSYQNEGRITTENRPDGTTRTYHYNDLGLLVKTTQPGQADTLYAYDALANLIRSGLDITGSGSLNPASADRITDTETLYQQDG